MKIQKMTSTDLLLFYVRLFHEHALYSCLMMHSEISFPSWNVTVIRNIFLSIVQLALIGCCRYLCSAKV